MPTDKSQNYKKMFIANIIRLFSIIFLLFCIWASVLTIKENDVYRFIFISILICVDIAINCIMDLWRKWIIFEKCDFQAQEKYVLSLLKRKRFKNNINLHIELLADSLILGKYDESKQEIEELRRLDSGLKAIQRVAVQFYNIDYMISVNETATLHAELENAENTLRKLSGISDRIKQTYQRNLRLRQYHIEERWEDALELLKIITQKNMTVYEQVNTAYYRGKYCYCLGRYEEAFYELKFVVRYGGNTKYVKLANDLIEKIPEKNLYENNSDEKSIKVKHRIDKKVIILIISCLLVILLIGFGRCYSPGNAVDNFILTVIWLIMDVISFMVMLT